MTERAAEIAATLAPQFGKIQEFIDTFEFSSFRDAEFIRRYFSFFGLGDVLVQLEVDRLPTKGDEVRRSVSVEERKPFAPDPGDLARLHWIVLTRRVLTALELGSGYSTVVIAHAMRILFSYFGDWISENLRVDRPFHVYSVEEEQWFANITSERLGKRLSRFSTITRSSVNMILHDNRIATIYSSMPNVSPDFIYIDGPSQFATTEEMNGFFLGHQCRMPMSADLLRIEFFLEPGTLIMMDGRTANARFLESYFRRNWSYEHDSIGDIHYFELKERPLGRINRRKMEFCLGGVEC